MIQNRKRLLVLTDKCAVVRALEDVAAEASWRAALTRRVYVGTPDAPLGEGAGDALDTLAGDIRATIAAWAQSGASTAMDESERRARYRAEALADAKALAVRIRDAGAATLRPDAPKDMRDVLAGGTGALNTFIHEVSAIAPNPAPATTCCTTVRAEALEEAAEVCDVVEREYDAPRIKEHVRGGVAAGRAAQRIRALITKPAPATTCCTTVRAEALEEAATMVDVGIGGGAGTILGARIRALITKPAPVSIPVEKVREVLHDALMREDDKRADFNEGWTCALMLVAAKLAALGMPGASTITPEPPSIPVPGIDHEGIAESAWEVLTQSLELDSQGTLEVRAALKHALSLPYAKALVTGAVLSALELRFPRPPEECGGQLCIGCPLCGTDEGLESLCECGKPYRAHERGGGRIVEEAREDGNGTLLGVRVVCPGFRLARKEGQS